jgi:gliding motility-associated-like protein
MEKMKRSLLFILLTICVEVVFGQYHVGDLFTAPDGSQGIVYYIHPDGSGGWVMALNDASAGCTWGANVDISSLPNQVTSGTYPPLLNDTAGYDHTLTIRTAQNNNPQYAAGVVDFDHGWVLPSPAQLSLICGQLPFVENALLAAGGTTMADGYYWCCAEYSSTIAWCVFFGSGGNYIGYFSPSNKSSSYRVRAVRSFSYADDNFEQEVSYTWSTGDTSSVITVTPTQTTTYSVIVTTPAGCSDTVEQTIVVNSSYSMEISVTACDSYIWNGTTYTESGLYTHPLGCQRVDTLHLTIHHGVTTQDTLVLVENQLPYYFAVADTTISSSAPAESQFSYHLFTAHDCDSTVQQTVIIHYNTAQTIDTTVCGSVMPYTWHNYQYTQAGSRNDTVLNTDGSDHIITYQLNVSNPTALIQNVTNINCYGASTGSVSILVSNGVQPYNCHWENEVGTTVSSFAQLSGQPVGTYYLYVTDMLGCQIVDSVTLTYLNDSMVSGVIANDQSVCVGHQPSVFTGTAASGGSSSVYQWQISTNDTTWTPAPTPNNTLNYTYPNAVISPFSLRRAWISTECGTVYSNTVNISVVPNYTDTITASVCQGYPYQENGFNISAEATASAGTITSLVHLQTESGCDSMITLLLTVLPSTYTEEHLTICQNELPYTYHDTVFGVGTPSLSTFNFQYSTAGGCDSIVVLYLTVNQVYELNLNDMICKGEGYNQNGFVVSPTQTQDVNELDLTQQLQSQDDCDSVVNLHLAIIDTSIAIVSLTPDFCEDFSAELMVETNATNYLWNTGETTQTIMVNRPGTYTVTASQGNCSMSAWYLIENCELNVYLPNAITPDDNDGLNDYFCIHDKYKPLIEQFEIRIYSRWGELVYYSNDKEFKWYGVHNPQTGKVLKNNIYTYLINFTDNRGVPYQLTGSITVL